MKLRSTAPSPLCVTWGLFSSSLFLLPSRLVYLLANTPMPFIFYNDETHSYFVFEARRCRKLVPSCQSFVVSEHTFLPHCYYSGTAC